MDSIVFGSFVDLVKSLVTVTYDRKTAKRMKSKLLKIAVKIVMLYNNCRLALEEGTFYE